jgi:tetratricopeptide (TPR) repeat protein
LAWGLYLVGRIDEAEETMKQAVASPAPFGNLEAGRTFLDLVALARKPRLDPEAEAVLRKHLREQPDHLPGLMAAAHLATLKGEPRTAKGIYEGIVNQHKFFGPAAKELAKLHETKLGDEPGALDWAVRARANLPEDPELAKMVGRISYRQKDYGRAVQALEDYRRRQPKDPEAFYFLGMAYYGMKDKDRSREALQKSLSLDPKGSYAQEATKILADL